MLFVINDLVHITWSIATNMLLENIILRRNKSTLFLRKMMKHFVSTQNDDEWFQNKIGAYSCVVRM